MKRRHKNNYRHPPTNSHQAFARSLPGKLLATAIVFAILLLLTHIFPPTHHHHSQRLPAHYGKEA